MKTQSCGVKGLWHQKDHSLSYHLLLLSIWPCTNYITSCLPGLHLKKKRRKLSFVIEFCEDKPYDVSNLPDNVWCKISVPKMPISCHLNLQSLRCWNLIKWGGVWVPMMKVSAAHSYVCACTHNRHMYEFYICKKTITLLNLSVLNSVRDLGILSSTNKRLTFLFLSPGWWLDGLGNFHPTSRKSKCKCDSRPALQASKWSPPFWSQEYQSDKAFQGEKSSPAK